MLTGNDVIIYVDGTAFAAAKSCEIDVSAEMIEVASPDNGAYRKYISGRKTWKVSVNCLVTKTLTSTVLSVGDQVRITMGVRVRGVQSSDRLTGQAIVTEARVSGSRGHMATGSFRFQGISELEQIVVPLFSSEPLALQDSALEDLHAIYI